MNSLIFHRAYLRDAGIGTICISAGCRGFTGPGSSAALDKDKLSIYVLYHTFMLLSTKFIQYIDFFCIYFFEGAILLHFCSLAMCFMNVSFPYLFIPNVSRSEQYLSAAHTSQLSLYRGSFVSVSGHICFLIMSSSRLVRRKYLTAFLDAVLGWANP